MAYWLQMLLGCTLSMGVVTCLMAALAPVISRRYSQRTVYTLLTIVLVGFLIPWRPVLPHRAVQIPLPSAEPAQTVPYTEAPAPLLTMEMEATAPIDTVQTDTTAATILQKATQATEAPTRLLEINWVQVTFLLWTVGVAAVLAKEGWRHHRFLRLVNRWAVPAPVRAQELLAQIAQGRKAPALFTCPAIDSPMVTGVFRPRLLLPESDAPDEDLLLMFRHELTHYRRGDVVVKLLIVVAKAIHWMNPAVYLLSREMNLYCETSCDEAVLKGCDKAERRRYAETVMSVLTQSSLRQTALCTGFQGGLKRTKRRILHMLDTRNKKNGLLLLVLVLMLSILSGAALAVETEATEPETALQLPLSNEIDRSLLTFEYSYPAILCSDTYGCIPVYPFYDDPTYPGALYSPGVPVTITGSVWRDERFRGANNERGIRYLQANIKLGERIEMAYIPEMFVQLVDEYPECVLPTATIVADEGQQHANLYEKMYTDTPSRILAGGSQVEIISRNEHWVQVRQGNVTGYVQAGNLTLDAATEKAFQPGFLEGYTDAPGYAYRSSAYRDWFNSMCLQYGSHERWDMEQLALMTEVQERYGQYHPGSTVYVLPGKDDFTKEEAIARAYAYLDTDEPLESFGIRVELSALGGNKENAIWRVNFLHPEKLDQSRRVNMEPDDGSLYEVVKINPGLEAAVIAKYGPNVAGWPMEYRKKLYPQDWALDHAVTLSDGTVLYVNKALETYDEQPDSFPCGMAEAIEKTIDVISATEGKDMRARLLSDEFIVNVKLMDVTDWQDGKEMGKKWQWNIRFSAPYEQQPYQYQVSVNAKTGEVDQFFDPKEIYRTQVDWQENHNGNG